MITVASAVEELISHSDFAIEGLQTGCLNMSVYADSILHEVEQLTKKPVQKGSVVVAISRLATTYKNNALPIEKFQLQNLVSRTGLTEITYTKTPGLQARVATLYSLEYIKNAAFFVSNIGLSEISIIADTSLTAAILKQLSSDHPILHMDKLASLTMQVGIETVEIPRQSYTVIKQLALRDITLVEYLTSPGELTIILHERDLKNSFSILYDKFFV
jgi:hypothetical protein